jgi:hypothetical protein
MHVHFQKPLSQRGLPLSGKESSPPDNRGLTQPRSASKARRFSALMLIFQHQEKNGSSSFFGNYFAFLVIGGIAPVVAYQK